MPDRMQKSRLSHVTHGTVVLSALMLGLQVRAVEIQQAAGDGARVQQVEQGLRPVVRIKGEVVQHWKLMERMAHYHVPGVAIAVLGEGKLIWARTYGVKDAGTRESVSPQTLFQAGSISKPVAALGTLELVQRGVIDLDVDVNRYLKRWQLPESALTSGDPVTLRRIMSHSAGLTVHGFDGYLPGTPIPSLPEILDGKPPANSPPVRVELKPGTVTQYSGGGTTIQQLLVEDVTGQPYADYLRQNVLLPLGMKASSYQQPLPPAFAQHASSGHDATGQPIKGRWHVFPEMAAAGLWTNATDLSDYLLAVQRAIAGNQGAILGKRMTAEMLSPQLPHGSYGLGPALRVRDGAAWFGHLGATPGFRARIIASFDRTGGLVVLTNGDNGLALAEEILQAVADAYGWQPLISPEKTLVKMPSGQLHRFEGSYRTADGSELKITSRDGRLIATLEGEPTREFWPQSSTRFFDRNSTIELAFTFDSSGSVQELIAYDDGDEAMRAKLVGSSRG